MTERMVATTPFRMRVPAEPAMAVSVRVFVAASARRCTIADADVEDLRLAATELLANAVEHGTESLELTLAGDDAGWRLTARGAGPLEGAPDLDGLPVRRLDILRGLSSVQVDNDLVVCSGPIPN
jgi:anti-sigma regulatory factor (Ser/Thr protein kinase)